MDAESHTFLTQIGRLTCSVLARGNLFVSEHANTGVSIGFSNWHIFLCNPLSRILSFVEWSPEKLVFELGELVLTFMESRGLKGIFRRRDYVVEKE